MRDCIVHVFSSYQRIVAGNKIMYTRNVIRSDDILAPLEFGILTYIEIDFFSTL